MPKLQCSSLACAICMTRRAAWELMLPAVEATLISTGRTGAPPLGAFGRGCFGGLGLYLRFGATAWGSGANTEAMTTGSETCASTGSSIGAL